MRVKELADLTGTTVRTVRHYHAVGLLAVPEVRDGHRDYDLTHVARLSRVRWLAQAGVPLSRIAGILRAEDDTAAGSADGGRGAIVTDLQATLVALDDQLAELARQRERVHRLVASVERDDHLSPMPPAVARFYDGLQDRAPDERVRRAIRSERDFMELAFYRGELPPEVALVYEGFDDLGRADSLAMFGEMADQESTGRAPSALDVERTAATVVARLEAVLGDDLARFVRAVDPVVARRAAELYVEVAPERDRPATRALAEAVLAALEEVRSR